MRSSTKKVLVLMIILLVLLIGVIVYLFFTDSPQKSEQELGQTVISEAADQLNQDNNTQNPEDPPWLNQTETETETETAAAVAASVDLPNEKEMRLYLIDFGAHTAQVVTEYTSTWDPAYDINTFEALNSDQDTLTYDDYFTFHESLWNAVDTQTQYKIGYELSFDAGTEHKIITILKPADISDNPDLFMGDADNDEVTGYLGVWVYNDIGQTGTYVHLTQEDMTDDTLMTSIKLRPTQESYQISNLKLKVFSYSSDEEFDTSGHYIGTHGYEIPIYNR